MVHKVILLEINQCSLLIISLGFTSQSSDMSSPDLHNFIKVTHETLHQNPQHPLSNFMVAEYLYHLGNYSKAAQFFKTVLANSNYFSSQHLVVDSAYYLGMCHFCSGSLIQAYELFEKTIQLDRTHPLAHFGLAQILLSRGRSLYFIKLVNFQY